jgi:hypothetical protein
MKHTLEQVIARGITGSHSGVGGEEGRIRGGGCRAASPPNPSKNRNLKNTGSVDIMISEVLRDFSFSRNQPLKLADDQYIRISKKKKKKKKKLMKLKKQEGRTL